MRQIKRNTMDIENVRAVLGIDRNWLGAGSNRKRRGSWQQVLRVGMSQTKLVEFLLPNRNDVRKCPE